MQTQQHLPERRDIRNLSVEDLDLVSGGMKWVPGTKNPDVIDARGGHVSFGIFFWTRDIDGNVSSVSVR